MPFDVTGLVDMEYVNGPPAPVVGAETVHDPFARPLQVTFEKLVIEVVGLPELNMVKGTDRVQVLTSFITTV